LVLPKGRMAMNGHVFRTTVVRGGMALAPVQN
jgi:hypothetical protein